MRTLNDSYNWTMGILSGCALLLILVGPVARADEASKLKACDLALQACGQLVYEEGASITKLKAQVSTLEDRLADAQSGPIVPTWLVIASSLVAGIAVGYTLGHH